MSFRRPLLVRPLVILSAVVALVLTAVSTAAATVPPEKQVHQIGHYAILDSPVEQLVNCHYSSAVSPKLNRFVAKPPKAWWWNHISENDNEHGTIGWQIIIQQSSNGTAGPWSKTFASSIVKKTAYEDYPIGYDDSKTAHFSKRTISWDRSGFKIYRVLYKLIWYNRNGTVHGTLTHWIDQYRLTGGTTGSGQGYCFNKLANID